MPQSSATWDIATLGSPMINRFASSQSSLVRSAEPIAGPARFRRTGIEAPFVFRIAVPMTATQWSAFRTFHQDTLDRGKLWFTMPLRVGHQDRNMICHFLGGYTQQPIGAQLDHAIVEFELEGFTAASTPGSQTPGDIVIAGTPAAPSPSGDVIQGGTPASPSPSGDRITGQELVGL